MSGHNPWTQGQSQPFRKTKKYEKMISNATTTTWKNAGIATHNHNVAEREVVLTETRVSLSRALSQESINKND